MKVKHGFVMRDVAGQTVIIATGEVSRTFQGMIRVNDTGKVIWSGLNDGLTVDQIVDKVIAEFDVDRATATSDVETFIGKMRDNGFLDE
ncbi:PqqD family protein [Bifidobacterium sp. UTBIF-78]|uniref:PqqD family protein n=1 Tax=Bifidobacterium sp. UTBIF-78 TaxID=1465263 RepID=UPI001126A3A4|nr:PqqD family protein [Bifidobacterium sp. UTBIF-78]TPF93379.1 pyrroloquinoline quinone biosynthesis protein [Bifidobacterium sp. UTBIF-78]